MAYFAPYINETGLHIPTYQDILDFFTEKAKTIFGQDIYLDSDSPDYQQLSIIALAANDVMQALQQEYNSRSPKEAVGTALDSIIKLNGMKRKSTSFSTVALTLTGNPNFTILNCVAGDINGFKWSLPSEVVFDNDGNATITAQCQTAGAITAQPGTITQIVTPVSGWLSVTNENAASVGLPVETDSKVRARQAISVELPSETLLAGTKAAIAALDGVSRFEVYENTTNVADSNNIPGHSICAVVEGGLDYNIAFAIYKNKGPGCGTYGTTIVAVNDPNNAYSNQIKFFRPTYNDIFVTINVKALAGWNDGMLVEIENVVISYLNNLKIGQSVTVLTGIASAVISVMPDIANPAFSVQLLTAGVLIGSQGIIDIPIAFNAIARTDAAKVAVVKV